jgi:hypothetical protein
LKATGFKPLPLNINPGFQNVPFKFNPRLYATAAAVAAAAENDPDAAAASAVGRVVLTLWAALTDWHATAGAAARAAASAPAPAQPLPEPVTPSREVFTKGCYFLVGLYKYKYKLFSLRVA